MKMNRYQMMKMVGSMQQTAYVRPITFMEGRASGMKGFAIKNDCLSFQVLSDKCLDIQELSYKGCNFSFLAKQGLIGRMDYDTHGEEGTSSIMGGLLFTCGLENTCLPCKKGETYYPMHGRIRSAPAEHVCASAKWEGDQYKLSVSGEMREAKLFGNNMTLNRTIETIYGEKSLTITDVIENTSYREEPMMILYHFNMGYPLLDEHSTVIMPTCKITPRDLEAEKNLDIWNQMERARENEPERVYLHELKADELGNTFACLINERRELGIKISFNKKCLPRFVQWKSLGAGDYAMGLEPTNSNVYGRDREGDAIHKLQPFEKEVIKFEITILDGKEELDAIQAQAHRMARK